MEELPVDYQEPSAQLLADMWLGIAGVPRFEDSLCEYIDACGGEEHSWVSYSKSIDCYKQVTRTGVGTQLQLEPITSNTYHNMRAVAFLLFNVLLTLKVRNLPCCIYAAQQDVIFNPKLNVLRVDVIFFIANGDDVVLNNEEQCKNAIIDAYRAKGKYFALFDDWLGIQPSIKKNTTPTPNAYAYASSKQRFALHDE